MRKTNASHGISSVFVFLLLGIFAVFSTVMVVLGAQAYKGAADRLAEHNGQRVAAAYVRSVARAHDEAGVLRVEDENCLAMEEDTGFDCYVTRVYVYDGMLREWYADRDLPFQPEQGEAVCPAEDMRAWINGSLLTVSLKIDGQWITVDTALRAAAR